MARVSELHRDGHAAEIGELISHELRLRITEFDATGAAQALGGVLRAHDELLRLRREWSANSRQGHGPGASVTPLQRAIGDAVTSWRIEAKASLELEQWSALSGVSECLRLAQIESSSGALDAVRGLAPDWVAFSVWRSREVSSHDIATSEEERRILVEHREWLAQQPAPVGNPAPGIHAPGTEQREWILRLDDLREILGIPPVSWESELDSATAPSIRLSDEDTRNLAEGRYSALPADVILFSTDVQLCAVCFERGEGSSVILGRRR